MVAIFKNAADKNLPALTQLCQAIPGDADDSDLGELAMWYSASMFPHLSSTYKNWSTFVSRCSMVSRMATEIGVSRGQKVKLFPDSTLDRVRGWSDANAPELCSHPAVIANAVLLQDHLEELYYSATSIMDSIADSIPVDNNYCETMNRLARVHKPVPSFWVNNGKIALTYPQDQNPLFSPPSILVWQVAGEIWEIVNGELKVRRCDCCGCAYVHTRPDQAYCSTRCAGKVAVRRHRNTKASVTETLYPG